MSLMSLDRMDQSATLLLQVILGDMKKLGTIYRLRIWQMLCCQSGLWEVKASNHPILLIEVANQQLRS